MVGSPQTGLHYPGESRHLTTVPRSGELRAVVRLVPRAGYRDHILLELPVQVHQEQRRMGQALLPRVGHKHRSPTHCSGP